MRNTNTRTVNSVPTANNSPAWLLDWISHDTNPIAEETGFWQNRHYFLIEIGATNSTNIGIEILILYTNLCYEMPAPVYKYWRQLAWITP